MKNLKVKFAKILILLSAIVIFNSCKKNKDVDANGERFDLTQYYITGSYLMKGVTTSYIYGFNTLARAYEIRFGGIVTNTASYQYNKGVLNVDDFIFNISNGVITGSNAPNDFKSYHLQKIPSTDGFAGKTFKGTVAINGVDLGKSCVIKFSNGKFTVSVDGFAQVGTGADYTLQNNGVATANTGLQGDLHLMSIVDNKMYYSSINGADTKHIYSLLTQQ